MLELWSAAASAQAWPEPGFTDRFGRRRRGGEKGREGPARTRINSTVWAAGGGVRRGRREKNLA